MINLKLVRTEYTVLIWPDVPPQAPFYDDCKEADAVAEATNGTVVMKAYYESDWMPHDQHG